MNTHNLWIYHCECCGKIVDQEPDAPPPKCCQREMVRAAARTVPEGPVPGGCGCDDAEMPAVLAVPKPR